MENQQENQELNKETSTIKLNIDRIFSKKHSSFASATLIALMGIFILASFTPESILTSTRPPAACSTSVYENLGYDCQPFDLDTNPVFSVKVDGLKGINKFVTLDLTFLNVINENKVSFNAQIEVSAFVMDGENTPNTIFAHEQQTLHFTCNPKHEYPCDVKQIVSIPVQDQRDFYFTIKFLNANDIKTIVDNVRVYSATLNTPYRVYLFAVRLTFLVITVMCLFWNSIKMSPLRKEYYTKEQKTLSIISPLLLIINEPFTVFLAEGKTYLWFTTAAFLLFSSLLLHFWLSNIDDLAGSDSSLIEKSSKFAKIYTALYLVVTLLTFISVVNFSAIDNSLVFDPANSIFFLVSRIILYITVAGGLGWIGYKTKQIIQRIQEVPERDISFLFFSYIFLFAHFYVVIRASIYPFSYDGTGVILFCGMSTLYTFVSSYLFIPTKEGLEVASYLKKYENPDAKANYDDLEKSVQKVESKTNVEPVTVPSLQHLVTDTGDNKPEVVISVGVVGGEVEAPVVEQSYPFDHKAEEEM